MFTANRGQEPFFTTISFRVKATFRYLNLNSRCVPLFYSFCIINVINKRYVINVISFSFERETERVVLIMLRRTLKLDIAMFGRKINKNKSVGGNIKESSLSSPEYDTCILHIRTCARRSRAALRCVALRGVALRRISVRRCAPAAKRQQVRSKNSDSSWTHYSVQERYITKGTTVKGRPNVQEQERYLMREKERQVHRGFRYPVSKQRDANLQREKRKQREKKREMNEKGFSIPPV